MAKRPILQFFVYIGSAKLRYTSGKDASYLALKREQFFGGVVDTGDKF
jgi:hypothetical protein